MEIPNSNMKALMENLKSAIVTGASRGIGAAIARHLASIGYAVIINYNTHADEAETVRAAISNSGGTVKTFRADISSEPEAEALIDFTTKAYGRLNLLVNNAGYAAGMPILEIDSAHIDQTFNVNVRGLLFCCKHATRAFGSAGGSIINISSVNATSPVPGGAAYSGSKAAVNAITVSLARELGAQNIRVNAVAPGLTMTERYLTEVSDEAKAFITEKTPLGRLGMPEDIVGLVGYLASDAARWVTGQVISASGGAV
jgi:3-oxoacyl-[acyl-carrier protein] reductase